MKVSKLDGLGGDYSIYFSKDHGRFHCSAYQTLRVQAARASLFLALEDVSYSSGCASHRIRGYHRWLTEVTLDSH